jgi:tRNA nucleotidyltransferase (CCA-adding enzyme)
LGKTGDDLGVAVHAVGGFVRDLLLDLPNLDLDITVEGDGIFFAETFGGQHGCRVRPHQAFGTAVVVFPDGRKLDVASTRLEYYDSPGVLPTVERASLRHDLYRRDFTINTLALCLNKSRFGSCWISLVARRTCRERQCGCCTTSPLWKIPPGPFGRSALNSVWASSLIPIPKVCCVRQCGPGWWSGLAGKRLMGELIHILKEQEPAPAIKRMAQLGLLPCIHPGTALRTRQRTAV